MTLLHDYRTDAGELPTPATAYRPPSSAATAPSSHCSTAPKGSTMNTTATRTRHALSVLVENNPGVLARVSVLFARRNFNIDHLVVGPTEDNKVSRMTVVVNVSTEQLHRVTSQLDKLVEVIHIEELDEADAIRARLWEINDHGPRPVGAMAAAAF
ncbi:acetolactate synthase small subunit [Ornithinimicrobium sufpigmenti]|uniref:acetolactate synthase small subunit n=1 Tax=Ornithinimicrobium sufpigmenti TaxID=2508882 RepID=UPI001EDD0AB1|nr:MULTISPECIES: acetolactate synthase small subunit [unclassified Ornithinimicrobium]